METTRRITALLATCLIAACVSAQTTDDESMSDDENKPDLKNLKHVATPTAVREAQAPVKRSGSIGPGMQRLVDRAKSDLMEKKGISADQIEVIEAGYVTWPDSSMGCAKPGFQYLQVLTNGSRIVFRAGNRLYHYHSGKDYPPFHCEAPTVKNPPPYAPDES